MPAGRPPARPQPRGVDVSTVAAGTPCWTDLATPDLDAARRFYPELFGWTGRIAPEPEAAGYTTFRKDGRAVAGAGPPAGPDQVPVWSTYVATDDADLVTIRVEAAGGQVLVAPFDVLDAGRMAVFADPAGAVFSVWQPMRMPGAELLDAPGAMCWNELVSPDPEGAKAFYELVFGWHPEDRPATGYDHTGWRCGARIVAGMLTPPGDDPAAGRPAYWSVFFAVADVDAAAARATTLGGTIGTPPRDTPLGRLTTLSDPQGARFSLLQTGTGRGSRPS
ncbi:VOC family protein [Micromonospora rifamycinica]|uniref:VOC family protein n=1 Tax=Micromonospora rifamycinica TaxID=291594 RepID=UPI003F55961E